jgi:predicted Fe-S protein YdhL (DUF1289 family)
MVSSPCKNICKYDSDFICIGCKRSREEITKWSNATDMEKLQILKNVQKRRSEEKKDNYDRYI